MSLHKAIKSGKEHRTEYGTTRESFAKMIDKQCRNHGGCDWCKGNRTFGNRRRKLKVEDTTE